MVGYLGKFRGLVFANNDPKKMLRIKAIVPAISSEPLNWALPCKDYLGKDCGDNILPGEKDGVWIEFEGGDTDFPIYVGMWAAKDDVPNEFKSSYNEKTRVLKDKNGNKIIMKDGKMIIISSGDIELGEGVLEKLIKGESFKTLYNAHFHTSPAGPTGIATVAMSNLLLSAKNKTE